MDKAILFLIFYFIGTGFYYSHGQAVGDIIIKSVDISTEDVVLENTTNSSITLSNWWLCQFPNYMSFSITIPANSTRTITFNRNLGTVDDLGLYASASFGSSTAIRDFVQWGAGNQGRSGVADLANIWEQTDFITGISSNSILCYGGTDNGNEGPFHTLSSDFSVETGSCSVAPVEIISFSGREENGQVKLKWATAIEINNKGFEMQRSSDLREWEVLDFITGRGNSNQIIQYEFLDRNAKSGVNYYRIKQVDIDGKFELFDAISVNVQQNNIENRLAFFPNPARDVILLEPALQNININEVQLYSGFGQLINSIRFYENNELISLDISNLKSGVYILKIKSYGSFKLIKL